MICVVVLPSLVFVFILFVFLCSIHVGEIHRSEYVFNYSHSPLSEPVLACAFRGGLVVGENTQGGVIIILLSFSPL